MKAKKQKNKTLTREKLSKLIKKAQKSGNWSKVENANVSQITDMSCLFYDILGITNLDLSQWDTSNVTNMSGMFSGTDFNSQINFDTSNVRTMKGMFFQSKSNQSLSFDTSKVRNMSFMFATSSHNQLLNFNTSNVRNMKSMFALSKYNQPLNFDTSNVKNMRGIFKGSPFDQDISDWVIKCNKNNQDVIKYRDEYLKRNK